MTSSLIQASARLWVEIFKLKPFLTASVTAAVTVIMTASTIYFDYIDKSNREAKRLENNNYGLQISQLEDTEQNIRQLLSFVKMQQASLRETEDNISKLKTEQEKLQPLVESNRAVVEALFREQEDRTNTGIWKERFIGFGFGIVASLIASFIWFVGSFLMAGRKPDAVSEARKEA